MKVKGLKTFYCGRFRRILECFFFFLFGAELLNHIEFYEIVIFYDPRIYLLILNNCKEYMHIDKYSKNKCFTFTIHK